MPDACYAHPAAQPDEVLLRHCEIRTGRSGGPGGQHRNNVETLVRLVHVPTGIESHAGERRSQLENKRVALRRLRLLLAIHIRLAVPDGDIGSDLWRSRRHAPRRGQEGGRSPLGRWRGGGAGVIQINPDHHDYPALLAEALDVIAACGWDAKPASLRLECSASQLIKLVAHHPPALAMWNAERAKLNLAGLRPHGRT